MSFELRVSSRAEADLAAAFDRYESRSVGLGCDFVQRVDEAIALIAQSPLLFPKRRGETRLAMTGRFPYAVYFIVDVEARLISIRRILHFSQNRDAQLGDGS